MANETSCENSRSTAHFTVTGANEAGVDLVLIRPFLLYYVNHDVVMLTTVFIRLTALGAYSRLGAY